MLAHLAAETPEPAAPEAGLQDPGGCQAACPACSGVTEASVTVCLFVNGGGPPRNTQQRWHCNMILPLVHRARFFWGRPAAAPGSFQL